MILDHTRSRRPTPPRILIAALGVGAVVLMPLAMLRPAARAQGIAPLAKRHMTRETARVSAVQAVPGELDAMRLVEEGHSLTPRAVADLENLLATRPDDYAAHIQLLGYYEDHRFRSALNKAPYAKQVFWLIRKHPTSVLAQSSHIWLTRYDGDAFEQGKALWLTQIAAQPTNTVLLDNAAGYCQLSDKTTAERLLKQAQALEPRSPHWHERLGSLYQLQTDSAPAGIRREEAGKALAEYEIAAALSPNQTVQHHAAADMAKMAFDAGEFDTARRYALDLLRWGEDTSGGQDFFHQRDEYLHYAHLILGRLALQENDMAQAEQHLLAMGQISGSPGLGSFGPNMQLAKDLLDRGDRKPVLVYFDECAKFWKMNNGHLAKWKAQVQQGTTPDFGANLIY